jgi:excisionase family DNA binding protein
LEKFKAGKINATRTLGGEYRIPESEVKKLLKNDDNNM